MFKRIHIVTFVVLFSSGAAQAEVATEAQMERVCQNWLIYMVHQSGNWAGDAEPKIVAAHDVLSGSGDMVLARCFSITPQGHVVVPVLMELPPIKAYSEQYGLDVDQTVGFPQLLREVLEHRLNLFIETYGSLDASQPPDGDVLFDRVNRQEWDLFLLDPTEFNARLKNGGMRDREDVGPLLTTAWHQGAPYNNSCPMGDGGRCVVGCVATAAAQIMKYHNWPPAGTGSHSYFWNGDQSCGGDVGGGSLSADFADVYDWANMPDDCDGGCSQAEQDALAELCYEVGVAFEMDYGACGSGTQTWRALDVLPTHFRYDVAIDQEDRDDHTAQTWFDLIVTQINLDQPILYRIYGHAIVCDGWRDTGGQNQIHMNYGWANSYTTWYTIDNLYCPWPGCDPMEEYLIRNIIPLAGNTPPILSNPRVDPTAGGESTEFEFTVHYYDADGDPPHDDFRAIVIYGPEGSEEHDMTFQEGSGILSDGTYYYNTTLAVGSYAYYFYFADTHYALTTTTLRYGPYVYGENEVPVTVHTSVDGGPHSPCITLHASWGGHWLDIPLEVDETTFSVPYGVSVMFQGESCCNSYVCSEARLYVNGDLEITDSACLFAVTFLPAAEYADLYLDYYYDDDITYAISGTVSLDGGGPVPGGVDVTLDSPVQHEVQHTTDGSFSFAACAGVTVSVTFSADGYAFSPGGFTFPNHCDHETGLSVTAFAWDVLVPTTWFLTVPAAVSEDSLVSFTWVGEDDVTAPEDLMYQYKLDAVDADWSAWGSGASASYDLANGAYTFWVRAKDEAGNYTGEETSTVGVPTNYTLVVNAAPRIASAVPIDRSVWASRVTLEMPAGAESGDTFVLLPQHAGVSDFDLVPVSIHAVDDPMPVGANTIVADELGVPGSITKATRGWTAVLPATIPPGGTAEYDIVWGKIAYFGWQELVGVPRCLPNYMVHGDSGHPPYWRGRIEGALLDGDLRMWRLASRRHRPDTWGHSAWLIMSVANELGCVFTERFLRFDRGTPWDGVYGDRYEFDSGSVISCGAYVVLTWMEEKETRDPDDNYTYRRYGSEVYDSLGQVVNAFDGEYIEDAWIDLPRHAIHDRIYFTGDTRPLSTSELWYAAYDCTGNEVIARTVCETSPNHLGGDGPYRCGPNVLLLWREWWSTPEGNHRQNVRYQVRSLNDAVVVPPITLNPPLLPDEVEEDDQWCFSSILVDQDGKVWIGLEHETGALSEDFYIIIGVDGQVWKPLTCVSEEREFLYCDRDGYIWAMQGGELLMLNSDDTAAEPPHTPTFFPNQPFGQIEAYRDGNGDTYRLYDRWFPQYMGIEVPEGVSADWMEVFDLDLWNQDVHVVDMTLDLNGCAVPFPPGVFTGHTSVDVSNCIQEGANLLTLTQEDFFGGQVLLTFPYVSRGACCFPDGSCAIETVSDCAALDGIFQGGDIACEPNNPCTGACCLEDGECVADVTVDECEAATGVWQGLDSMCEPNNPCTGACCLADGTCVPDTTVGECEIGYDGEWQGLDVMCEPNPCHPYGACCFAGGCLLLKEADCAVAGGTWVGAGTDCTDSDGDGIADECEGACCLSDGTCADATDEDECAALGGTHMGLGVHCEDIDCHGACCFEATGGCLVLSQDNCATAGGSWAEPDTDCADDNCSGIADECECPGDIINDDGFVGLNDLAQLLGRYGMTSGATYYDGDLDCDGDVDLSDLAELLGRYGTTCP